MNEKEPSENPMEKFTEEELIVIADCFPAYAIVAALELQRRDEEKGLKSEQ